MAVTVVFVWVADNRLSSLPTIRLLAAPCRTINPLSDTPGNPIEKAKTVLLLGGATGETPLEGVQVNQTRDLIVMAAHLYR